MKIVKTITAGICVTSSLVAAEITTPNGRETTDPITMEQKIEQSSPIHKVTSFTEVPFSELKEGDTVVFDIYGVLISSSTDHNIMHNKNGSARFDFLKKIREEAGDERVGFAFDKVNFGLVEQEILDVLKDLRSRGVYTFGVTVSRTGIPDGETISVEDTLINRLRKAGIQFNSPFDDGNYSNLNLFSKNNTPTEPSKESFAGAKENILLKGTFLTNNRFKIEPVSKLLSLNPIPDKIFIIDKTEGPLKDMLKAFPDTVKAFQYTESNDYSIDQEVVDEQLRSLLQDNPEFPTDQEARQRIETKKSLAQ